MQHMKVKTMKNSRLTWFPVVCLLALSTSCDLATEQELEGPTQVAAKQEMGPTDITAQINSVGKDGKKIFDVTEVQPIPPGGMLEWNNYLSTNISYPAEAKAMGVEGIVIVTFVINSDGSVSDAEIVRGVGAGCDEEALRVVKNSANWTPAIQSDLAVNSRMHLPIKFKLS